MKKNEKGFGAIEGLLIVVIICMIGFVGWYVWHNRAAKTTPAPTTSTTSTAKVTTYNRTTTVPTDWKTYSNPTYKLSLAYPSGGWSVSLATYAKSEFSGENGYSKNATSLASVCYLPPNVRDFCYAKLEIIGQSLSDTISQIKKDYFTPTNFKSVKQTNLTIDGHNAVEIDAKANDGSEIKYFFSYANGYTFAMPQVLTSDPSDLSSSSGNLSAKNTLILFESVKID